VLEVAQHKGDYEARLRLRFAKIPELEFETPTEGTGSGAMLSERITPDDKAGLLACATDIAVRSLLKGKQEQLVRGRVAWQ
jgi:hypothetical protein